MKKRLNSSILAATSLTAITAQHQVEATTLTPNKEILSALSYQNQLQTTSDVTTLDFSNLTPDIVNNLSSVPIDLSSFQNVRDIILPWFAANLNITLPEKFSTPLDNKYSRLTIVQGNTLLTKDSDLSLNLENLLKGSGKVILDTKAVPLTEVKAGVSVAKIERNVATTNLTVSTTIEAIDTNGVMGADVKTSTKIIPAAPTSGEQKPQFLGLPAAVIGANPATLDISAFKVDGKDVSGSGMSNLTNLVLAAGDSIGSLSTTGEKIVTTNAASVNKIEFTSTNPSQTVVDTMSATATTVTLSGKESHIASFKDKTELDFSKLDLGSVDATATRIKDIFDGAVPITSIVSMKISSAVLAAVMTKLSIANLSSFSALKRLDIISATGVYQTSALTSADLPSGLEAYYSSNLVVRKGTLSANLELDSKFSAATLDLSGLVLNSYTLTIANSFTANSVSTLKLNPSLLAVAATKNLISANSSKSITVSGAASGELTTTNLQNVGTIDLRLVTGATSLSAPLNVGGNNSILSSLYLPSAFNVEATADILSGVDNGEVTVYLSGAYSGAKTLDASYDNTILNFSGVTGTGRFQLPAGVRGLVLSNAVKGIKVGAAAVLNEFDFSGLTYIRQITDLPTSATVLKINNTSASSTLQLNLTALTSLTTLQLGSSRVSQLSLPASYVLTDGGEEEHLDLSNITGLAVLNGLNALLAEGSITQVSFPNNPASALRINLVETMSGIQFNNLDKIPELTIDSDYSAQGSLGSNLWPTVKDKSSKVDWSKFFKYITASNSDGGINSPSIFDLSGQALENQGQATALADAFANLSQASKSLIQKIIIRLDAAVTEAINLTAITTTHFTHSSLEIIIDQSTGSTATVSVPGGWTAKTKTHVSLDQVAKTTPASWTNYLNYRFASPNDKGQGATSLDLSSIDLTAAQWTALMTALNSFSTPEAIQTIHLKLAAADNYSAPAFTTATLSAATSIIVDVTDVKNSGTQVAVTELPSATVNLQVEQRVTGASSVDRTNAASWKGYVEKLLSTISGSSYTLDLTATDVQIQTASQLTALNSALAGLSAANKAKIQNIKLKIASGNRAADFTVSTNFTGFTNIASLIVDATDALNGTAQSAVTFSLTNAPAYAKAHVTSLASVDTDVAASWDYYLAYRLATNGVLLTNLDLSSISLAAQADLTAFLTALNNQSGGDKSSVQSIKLKLATAYSDATVDFSVNAASSQISGLDHGSFAVEVDRNGANSTSPVTFTFGTAITAAKTTIKDTAFTGLGSFDATDAHHWLGYVRTLLGTVSSGTTTVDLSTHSALEVNNAKLAKFIVGMNALPDTDKAKVATLKVKLASGDFGAATADLSGLSGFTNLANLVVDRNSARSTATLYDPAVTVSGPGTITINDSELRTVSATGETNKWLGYLRFVLNGMSGTTNTLDLSAFAIDSANAATAFNNALEALPASEKLKIQTLKLSANFAVTLGTGVSGFTNLTKVIVDQTAAPTVTITIAAGTVATGEFADATTQKFYVTSAATAQTNNAWDKYIDYAMSSIADGGLNQTTFDLTALMLDNGQVGQFFAGFTGSQKESVTSISLKLATAFGADTLTLPAPGGFTNLTSADAFKIYRNGAANVGPLVSVDYNSWDDSVVQIIDPTATTVAVQTSAQDWLNYLSYVTSQSMFDATSGFGAQSGVLDLSSLPLASSGQAVALITALGLLDSSLKAKLTAIDVKLASGAFGAGTLALSGDLSNNAGFTNLTKFMVDATGTETNVLGTQKVVDFSGLSVDGSKDMWVSSLASVDYDSGATAAAASWLAYIHYQIRNGDTNFALDTSTINEGAGLTVTQAGYLFDALETLSLSGTNKERLTSVTVKLAKDGGAPTLTIDQNLNNLNGLTSIVVNVTDAMNGGAQVAVTFSGSFDDDATTTKKAIVSSLSYVDKDSIDSWTYFFNSGAMTSVDVSSLTLTSAEATAFLAALGTGVTLKANITSLTMKLDPTFGANTLTLPAPGGFTSLTGVDAFKIYRNGAANLGTLVSVDYNSWDDSVVQIIDPTATTVADQTSAQDWLAYLTGVLNDEGTGYVLDLRSRTLSLDTHIDAINSALNALNGSYKTKVAELRLTVTADGELGTGVSGFTNLSQVIVDQTAAPTEAITIVNGFGTTQKLYVTSASTAQTSGEWGKYIDYAMSLTADGGLEKTTFDLTALTLDHDQVGQFLTALDAHDSAEDVTSISLKLAANFDSELLDLSVYTNLAGLGADSVVIYRNGSSVDGSSAPVTVTYGGSFTDSVVQIIDPTAGSVTDTAVAQQWLGYLTGVLNDSASGATLDLSSIAIDDAEAVTAFNAAIVCLDSALSNKIAVLKLAVTHAADITLGTGSAGFSNLSHIEFTKTATNTVTFAGALAGKRTYLTNLASVKMDTSTDWSRYLNYMLSTTDGGQNASSLNLNSRTFANQTAVDAFFAGLDLLDGEGVYGDKAALKTLRMKLANGLEDISIGGSTSPATGLAAGLIVIVDPGTSTETTHAGSNDDEVQADNLIVLSSTPAFSKGHFAYLAEQNGFRGTIDLTGLNLDEATGTNTLIQELNLLSADTKAAITTINLKLQSGNFGSLTLTLDELIGFTGVTFNVDRNGAVNSTPESALVVITNNTGHIVNLTDAEFHDMSTFDNESSAHWIGYLTHELNSAPADYTLDLTVNTKLMLDSDNSVSAFNSALIALPTDLKTKVALLKVKSSTSGELGTSVTGFGSLATIVVDYTAASVAAMTGANGFGPDTPDLYHYISDSSILSTVLADWTKYFDYQLNAADIGGLAKTSISLDKRLSSADLTAVLSGLNAATNKASLENLTLNLASDVTGDIIVGVAELDELTSVTINTNGSAAKLTPTDDFIGNITFSSISNVKADSADSWAAYLAGQSSIAAIDIREVELADQAQLTAFLIALNAESRKATVDTIKLKLASAYADTVDFSVDTDSSTGGTQTISLATIDDAGVEIHRNGSAATAVPGGDITDAKIKLVDLTASSLTDRSSDESWRRYLTALIEDSGFAGSIDLSDLDTYLRINAHATAFMSGLQNLSPANKLLVTSLKLELAPGAGWTDITDLGQGLSGFDNLASFIVDATGAYTAGGAQATVAFHADLNAASPKVIVTNHNSVDKDSIDSWTYFFNSAAMTSVDVSSLTLTSTEATAFLEALGTGVTLKANITALTMKLDPTFGAGSLEFDGSGFTGLQVADAVSIQRNGAVSGGTPVSINLSNGLTSTHVRIVDPTITDADSVLKTSASSWLAYLTDALAGVAPITLDLTDDNLVLGTQGQATALSSALNALDSTLKAKIVTLKVKAAANVTIGATLTTAGGFTTLTAIELDKPVANTIAVSTVDAATQLRIADLANVKRDSSSDWLAYIQYLMKDLGPVTNFDLDMTSSPLADGELQAFVDSLITISHNANDSNYRDKIEKVRMKLAPGVWSNNITNLGTGWDGFMSNINTFTVDATGATFNGDQLTVSFNDVGDSSDYTRAFVTDLNSVDKDSAASWEYYLNYVRKDGAAGLDVSALTLTLSELTALDTAINAFSTDANNAGGANVGNAAMLSSIHIKVSGAAGAATVHLTADLDAQTDIDSAAKFIVDVSGFTHASSQAIVDHTGGNPKPLELRIAGASDLYRDSSASWGMYLNSVYAGGIPNASTLDFTGSSNTYVRNQADVNALMTAIEARSDKANIDTLNVRLAPGSVGSDITFGTGVTVINPTINITATGATNNGSMITAADIHYAGSFTSTGKTVTQDFAITVVDKTVQANWTSYFKYVLSSTAEGGLGYTSIVAPALTSGAQLTAMMNSLNGLSNELKVSIQHLHLDVSHASFNGALTLGTGVSGLDNLVQVSYVRASAQAVANAAVVGAGDFTSKIQRLRTTWNADTLASAATVESYLRYVLMDVAMGGAELTLVDLTSQELDTTGDGYVYGALDALPSELQSRITELRLKFNVNSGGNYSGITLPNLTTVKYFQFFDDTELGFTFTFLAPSSNASVTTTQFRTLAQVSDKADQAHWSDHIIYVMTSVNDGGLGQTTLDLSSITLATTEVVPFLNALDAHAAAGNVTALTLKLDSTFGAEDLDLSGYTNLTDLGADSVTIQRNAAVEGGVPVTITYGGSFTDANVKIIDPETNTTADKDNTPQQWLEYLTYTINTVGLTSGLLTIAPGDAFTSQAQIYALFDAMEALDPSLKADVIKIIIDISSIAGGTVSLKRTDDAALTGFSNLTEVIYSRAGIDTNIDLIITDLQAALDADVTLDAIPVWVFADEGARDTAIGNAVGDGSIRTAISTASVAGLKSALVTQLANGITFPASDVCDADVDTAAGEVDVTVDGDQKLTLATALTPFRSTGKISAIQTAITDAFTNGVTTGLETLPWLKPAWGAYANHSDVMTDVLADGTVSSAVSTEGQTIADIKTAVSDKLNSMLLTYGTLAGGSAAGSLGRIIFDMDLSGLTSWNDGTTIQKRDDFRLALESAASSAITTAWPWMNSTMLGEAVNTAFPAEGTFFPLPNTNGDWDATTIKQELFDRLQGIDDSLVEGFSAIKASIPTMINAAFTAADSGDALTDGTAAWTRPTVDIESDLTTSIETALGALPWYAGVAATQAADAVTAGDVANQDAATIISNIKTWLATNVVRPTADSIFAAGVSDAVDAIDLTLASTAVSTDFAGVAETLTRYRVAATDVSDKENGGQWSEYLLHKLRPVAEGGLGATTLDISAAPLGNDQKNNFMGALSGLPDDLRESITSIKFAAADNTVGSFDGGGHSYNDNLKIIMIMNSYSNGTPTLSVADGQEFFAEDGTTPLVIANVIDYRITAAPAVTGSATEWERYLNHKLSSTFGGDGVTSIDLSATHAFTTQAQLNTFFAGLEALDGTGAMANKNLLESLTLKLVAGDFGAASARIGYTGSAAVTGLKSDIGITIQRNGARNGAGTELALVTIDHSDIDALSSVDGVTIDNTDAVDVDNLSSSAEWMEYLNSTLTAADAEHTLDLTAGGLQLAAGTSATEATALFNALQALNPTLKAKIETIKIKLASGDHGDGALALSGSLDIAAGFTALARIIVDVTDAETSSVGQQKTIDFSGVTVEAAVKTVMWVDALAKVDFDSGNATESWLAYINYITRTGTAALDTSAVNSGNGLTVAQLNSVFDALKDFSDANDNPARLTGVTAKMAEVAGSGTFAVNQVLSNLSGLTSIIINATDAMDSGDQVTVGFGGTFHVNTTTKEARITLLDSVDLDNSDSWAYYLNYLKATNGDIESIDLSARDLAGMDSGTTQPYVDAFFTALNAHADKATVKDIFFDISGVDGLGLNLGTGSAGLTALTSVVIRRHAGEGSGFTLLGGVDAQARALIKSDTTGLGAGGSIREWKGYLAYLLEDAAHGGAYTGSDPIALNLSATALNIDAFAPLRDLEIAIAQLPARLKARISAIVIKTTASAADYTNTATYEFGDAFTAPILAELSALKAVVIDASLCTGTNPVFDTDGAFFNATTISKIVY